MKKSVLSLLIGSAMLIAPMTASALTPMTADSLKDTTGQAGVSIAIDGVKLESHVGAVTYTDDDGYSTLMETVLYDGSDGALGFSDKSTSIVIGAKHKVQYINAIIGGQTSDNARLLTGVAYDYVNTLDDTAIADDPATVDIDETVLAKETKFETRALTIDAGTCRLLTKGLKANKDASVTAAAGTELASYLPLNAGTFTHGIDVAGVVIGLPTIEIHTSADSYAIGIVQTDGVADGSGTALNSGKNFISISKEASTLAILGGVLEIAPH